MVSSQSVHQQQMNEMSGNDDEWLEVYKASDSSASEEDITNVSMVANRDSVMIDEQDPALPSEPESTLPSHGPPTSPVTKPSINIESTEETMMRLANEFPRVVEPYADTLVYLGIPPRAPRQTQDEYNYVKQQFEAPYLMHSSTLRKLGSGKFDTFLGPMSARTERRLKKLGVHKYVQELNPVRYYVDLSPVLNDEEALIQVTELTVPQGALQWHRTARDLGIPVTLVCGRDSLSAPPRLYDLLVHERSTIAPESNDDEQVGTTKKTERNSNKPERTSSSMDKDGDKPDDVSFIFETEEEYTPLRHHTAVARLLQAISGSDPKLNSAAKVWTFTMLAKYFDCAHHNRVNHWIVSWLLQGGNYHFIQRLPDVSYRLALATKSQWLMRCTFAILVGQQAVVDGCHHLESSSNGRAQNRHVAETLDDDEINRIDHAASALASRIKSTFDELVVFPGLWTADCDETSSLRTFQSIQFSDGARKEKWGHVQQLLQNYLRRMIYMTLSHQYDLSASKYVPVFSRFRQFANYTDVPRTLRPLTEQFWHILSEENFLRDYSETRANHIIWDTTQESLRDEGIIADSNIPYTSRRELYDAIDDLNRCSPGKPLNETSLINSPKKKIRLSIDLKEKSRDPDWEPSTTEVDSEMHSDPPQSSPPDGMLEVPIAESQFPKAPSDFPDREVQLPFRPVTFRLSQPTPIQATVDTPSRAALDRVGSMVKSLLNYEKKTGDVVEQPIDPTSVSPKSSFASARRGGAEPSSVTSHVGAQNRSSETLPPQVEATPNPFVDDLPPSSANTGNTNTKRVVWNTPAECWGNPPPSPSDDFTNVARNSSLYQLSALSPPTSTKRSAWASPADPQVDETQAYSEAAINRSLVPIIEPVSLLQDFQSHLRTRLRPLVEPGYVQDGTCDFDIPINEISTLLCLTDNEWKYLPLWAGGFDDGTGGVFNDGVEPPDAPAVEDGGFRGGAMGIIPGVGSSFGGSMAGSEFEDIATEVGVSTVGKASRLATDGTATETVMSLDE